MPTVATMSDRVDASPGPKVEQEADISSVENRGLDLVITDVDIEKIAREHLTEWRTLAPHLGLSLEEETSICRDFKDSFDEQKRHFLLRWKKKKGQRATYRALRDAAREIENVNLSEEVTSIACSRASDLQGTQHRAR